MYNREMNKKDDLRLSDAELNEKLFERLYQLTEAFTENLAPITEQLFDAVMEFNRAMVARIEQMDLEEVMERLQELNEVQKDSNP